MNRSFQSIGVTKDWRPCHRFFLPMATRTFPINRRHQGLATCNARAKCCFYKSQFPINRRHQGLATSLPKRRQMAITKRFQSIGVTKDWRPTQSLPKFHPLDLKFPINRRHQGLATPAPRAVAAQGHPKAFARSPIMGLQTPVVYPEENLEILCSAVERAAPRGIGGSSHRQSCAIR